MHVVLCPTFQFVQDIEVLLWFGGPNPVEYGMILVEDCSMYACQAAEVLAEALRAQACRLQLLSNSAGGYALNPKPKWKLSKIRDPKV